MADAPVVLRSWSRGISFAVYYFMLTFVAVLIVGALALGGTGLVVGGWLGTALGVLLAARTAAARVVVQPDGTLDVRNPLRTRRVRGSGVTGATLTTVAGRLTAVRLTTSDGAVTLAALDGPLVARLRQVVPWASAIEWPEWPRRGGLRVLFGRGRVS